MHLLQFFKHIETDNILFICLVLHSFIVLLVVFLSHLHMTAFKTLEAYISPFIHLFIRSQNISSCWIYARHRVLGCCHSLINVSCLLSYQSNLMTWFLDPWTTSLLEIAICFLNVTLKMWPPYLNIFLQTCLARAVL